MKKFIKKLIVGLKKIWSVLNERNEHWTCPYCGKLGHVVDMEEIYINADMDGKYYTYMHSECYAKKYKKKRCPCGKGWIDKKVN